MKTCHWTGLVKLMCLSLLLPCVSRAEDPLPMPDEALLLFLGESVEVNGHVLDPIEVLDLGHQTGAEAGYEPPEVAGARADAGEVKP